ncbi:MAG: N-acetylmuramyl-L-alanine amidase, negative regulator of AmpC, AmpD [Gammaproteobacteria bacterium]|nr:N-acetylmuramyl-L-alanine amidase, negative regulator of AmpC, AmpD [Gammaproteobacteria bacterium]
MKLTLNAKGWVEGLRHCPSPFYNERPANALINLLVIHNISLPPGEFGGHEIEDFFQGKLEHSKHPYFESIKELKVSAHFVIKRSGEIVQFVSVFDRAWHAGKSSFQGKENCNDYSIGIELEGTDDIAFSEQQYQALAKLSHLIMQNFPGITLHRIAGHSDIAPGRKTDPGPCFDWDYYREMMSENFKT